MTDVKRLKARIQRSGLKLGYIAEKMGITYPSLTKKVHNRTRFTADEVKRLCGILGIGLKEMDEIFLG